MANSDLKDFVEQVTGDSHLRVEDDLGDGFVRLRIAEAERRQAKHDIRGTEDIVIEMLRNARDAHARNIFVAVSREANIRTITMIDDGDGIPEHMFKTIFDARVTSKLDSMHIDTWGVHGRGMALYAVSVNALSARVAASKDHGGGTSIVVKTDTNDLPEKADQSTIPVFALNEQGTVIVRGPRNIIRTIAEFAYIDREMCTVYTGSQTEIAATLWQFGCQMVPESTRAFCKDPRELPVCKRLALAATPEEFADIAADLGLDLSERSARRIMDGQIPSAAPLAESIVVIGKDEAPAAEKPHERKANLQADARGLKIAQADSDEFADAVAKSYRQLAEGYYLDPSVRPEVRVRKDRIDITIPVRRIR